MIPPAPTDSTSISPDQGCFREGTGGRALNQMKFTSGDMTNEACDSFCAGFRYHATEYGTECYCGTKLENGAYQVPDSSCGYPCAGDVQQTCGGGNLLSVYKSNFTSQRPQFNYTSQGCVGEPDNARALDRVLAAKLMTTGKCLVICSYGNFQYAGLEYGTECWCGNTLGNVKTIGICNMPCAGNTSETCGGSFSLNLYSKSS